MSSIVFGCTQHFSNYLTSVEERLKTTELKADVVVRTFCRALSAHVEANKYFLAMPYEDATLGDRVKKFERYFSDRFRPIFVTMVGSKLEAQIKHSEQAIKRQQSVIQKGLEKLQGK